MIHDTLIAEIWPVDEHILILIIGFALVQLFFGASRIPELTLCGGYILFDRNDLIHTQTLAACRACDTPENR